MRGALRWTLSRLRPLGTALAAGLAGGVAAGIGARAAMRVVNLVDRTGEGGSMFASPSFTVGGTFFILVLLGIGGTPFGLAYLVFRSRLPRAALAAGLVFGAWLLLLFGPLFFLGEFREFGIPPWDRPHRLALFASLFLLYGIVVGIATALLERVLPRRAGAGPAALGVIALLPLAGAAALGTSLVVFGVVPQLWREGSVVHGPGMFAALIPWIALGILLRSRRSPPLRTATAAS